MIDLNNGKKNKKAPFWWASGVCRHVEVAYEIFWKESCQELFWFVMEWYLIIPPNSIVHGSKGTISRDAYPNARRYQSGG